MFRFEYDRVEDYHGCRQEQPWDLGGVRILHIDGVNGGLQESAHTRRMIDELELRVARDAHRDGVRHDRDNHYGYTVEVFSDPDSGTKNIRYQLRFSDGSLTVWLMQ